MGWVGIERSRTDPVVRSQPRSKVFADSWNKLREVCYEDEVLSKDKRKDLVEEELLFAKDTCEDMGIPVVKRTARRKKIMPGEKAADEPLTLDQELKRSMLECIERFQQEIDTRCENIECLSDGSTVLEPSNLVLGNRTSQVWLEISMSFL
ncbi:hypothetical protein AVEN_44245-1 [Araneus ventricosus]|uniref:Uncharacterized protein n=1 Tax=Araneus ventricosus TaxID=182803 RepID=A0A4Y2SW65_ARAVE|nr:hypothetical protein AVEN_44245-1 [Araneus ventricosus]